MFATAYKCDHCDCFMAEGEGFTFHGKVMNVGQPLAPPCIDLADGPSVDYCIRCIHDVVFKPLGYRLTKGRTFS